MENYEIFGDYIEKSKQIRQFCEKNESLLFEALRMDIPSNGVRKYLAAVGKEIETILDYVQRLKENRESNIATLEKHC
jgi:hypothetical protein